MKNNVLFVGEKFPKWTKSLENDFDVAKEKDSLKAYKSIFQSVPDLIIFLQSENYYDGYYLSELLKQKDSTKKIPFVVVGNNLPEYFKDVLDLKYESDGAISGAIKNIIKEHKLTSSDKKNIEKDTPSAKDLKIYTKTILDKLLISSTIVEEFKSLIYSMNFENVLVDNIFKIVNKYLDYDIAGIFINNTDESAKNELSLSIPHNNVTLDLTSQIRDEFFDKVEKFKRVDEIQCNLSYGNVAENSKIKLSDFKTAEISTYKYEDALTGGVFFCSTKPFNIYQKMFCEVIKRELDVVFKLKYLFNLQAKHAFMDPMTGLYNRQLFDSNIENEFYRARRYVFNFSLAMLDVDYLSKINEEYGKDFGDYVLTELSSVLKSVFRKTDLIYRYGGEEIIIYLPSTPVTKALIPIERLRQKIAEHKFEKDGKSANVTVSIGLCANYSKFTEPKQLLDGVADAMMRAKKRGRNKVDIFE